MILLPNECLFNIFINLKDNYKTLFSCLLVNRQWCRIVVPILWSKLDISNNLVLVKNCLLTLNKEEKELLKQFEIIIPDNPKSKPLFEYVSYCEVIKLNSDNGIINWLNYEKYGPCDLEATTKFGEMVYWITHLWHGHRDLTYNPYSERSKNMVKTIKYTLIKMFLRTKKVITLKSFNTLLGSEVDLMIEAVHKNIALKRLILRNNQLCNEVGEAFAKALYNNTMLIQLSFSGNNLNSEGVKALTNVLRVNTTLKHLCLNNNNIDSEGGKALAEVLYVNTTLTHLCLNYNSLGSEGGKALAKALCKNKTLIYLSITNNLLGYEGAKALAEALYKNNTLTHLILQHNNIFSEGGKIFIKAISKNTRLSLLYLKGNEINYQVRVKLINTLQKKKILTDLNRNRRDSLPCLVS